VYGIHFIRYLELNNLTVIYGKTVRGNDVFNFESCYCDLCACLRELLFKIL
jgi:hypothetical protein